MRIVLATVGSLGDLHPYIAIALRLRTCGHTPILATNEHRRQKVESYGIEYNCIRPNHPAHVTQRQKRLEVLLREVLIANVRQSYTDLLRACKGADILFTNWTVLSSSLVAAKTGIKWISSVLQPMPLVSAYDPPLFPFFPFRFPFGACFHRGMFNAGKMFIKLCWSNDWNRLQKNLGMRGLPNPITDGHSPSKILAMFSKYFCQPQLDWPFQVVQTGFPFLDESGNINIIEREEDEPLPIVFTLGSWSDEAFFSTSIKIAKKLKRKALLLGHGSSYIPFADAFSQAEVVVHHGGIGTTALALRTGKPSLIIPQIYDQFDNADHAAKIGAARVLNKKEYTIEKGAREVRHAIRCTKMADKIGEQIRREDGIGMACLEILNSTN